jgi:tape measure domain-containing protein
MSNSVDQRIVEMQFDNAQFEKGVATTLASLKKLDQSLEFKEGMTGIKNIDSAISKVDFAGMESSLSSINNHFSVLGIAGVTAIAKITDSLMNMATTAAKAITIDPLLDGLDEYKLKMDSIKTIQANTGLSDAAGMQRITGVLNDLNEYADKTIYNFAEMTKNIGTFTAAGIGLEESATAIQGIANLAAASGSSSQQASVAMYQLSQALAAGTVKLMDWNSVVNAGMGGQMFQKALIATSEALGTGANEYIAAEGSFRESLKKGWVTSEVLTKTLRNFTLSNDEASKQMLLQEGYNEEQVAWILRTAEAANAAATKVKTFQQLIDTTKEALGSGWATTWEYIIGDIMQAETLWTSVSEGINGVIDGLSDARNDFFKAWNEGRTPEEEGTGGWWDMYHALEAFAELLSAIVKPIQDAFADVFGLVRRFDEVVNEDGSTTKVLVSSFRDLGLMAADATHSFREFAESLAKAFKESNTGQVVVRGLYTAFSILFTVVKVAGAVIGGAIYAIGTALNVIAGIVMNAIELAMTPINMLLNFLESINYSNLFAPIVDFFENTLNLKSVAKVFEDIGAGIHTVFGFIRGEEGAIDKLTGFMNTISGDFGAIAEGAAEGLGHIAEALGDIAKAGTDAVFQGLVWGFEQLQKLWSHIGPVFETVKDTVVGAWNVIVDAFQRSGFSFDPFIEMFSGFGEAFKKFFENIIENGFSFDALLGLFDDLGGNIGELIDKLAPSFETFTGTIGSAIRENLDGPLADLFDLVSSIESPLSLLSGIIDNLGNAFQNISQFKFPWDQGGGDSVEQASGAINKVYDGITAIDTVASKLMNPMGTISSFVSNGLNGVLDGINSFVDSIDKSQLDTFVSRLMQLGSMSAIIAGLYEFLNLLHSMSGFLTEVKKIPKALTNLATGLSNAVKVLQTGVKVHAIKEIAIAVALLVASLFALTLMDFEKLQAVFPYLLGILAGLLVVAGVISKLGGAEGFNVAALTAFAGSMLLLAGAIGVLALVVSALGALPQDVVANGIKNVALIAVVIAGLALALSAAAKLAASGSSVGLAGLAGSIAALLGVMTILGALPDGVLLKGIIAFSFVTLVLSGLAALMSKFGGVKFEVATTGLMGIAGAILLLSGALGFLSLLDSEKLLGAVESLGILMLVLGVTAAFMSSINPASLSSAALGMIAFAASIGILAGAVAGLAIVASMGSDIAMATEAIGLLIVLLAGASLIIGVVGPELAAASTGITSLAIAIAVLAAAIVVFSYVPAEQMWTAIGQIAVALLVLVAAFAAMAVVAEICKEGVVAIAILVAAIGLAAALIGVSALSIAVSLAILAAVGPEAAASFVESIKILGQGLWDAKVQIALGIAGIVSGVVGGILMSIPTIAAALLVAIGALVGVLISAAPLVGTGAILMIAGLIDGLATGLEQYGPVLVDAVLHLGQVIIDGVLGAISDGFNQFNDWLYDVTGGLMGVDTAAVRAQGQSIPDSMAEGVQDGTPNLVSSIDDARAKLNSSEQGMSQDAAKNGSDIMAQFQSMADGLGVPMDQLAETMPEDMQNMFDEMGGIADIGSMNLLGAMDSGLNSRENPLNKLANSGLDAMENISEKMSTFGHEAVSSLNSGVDEGLAESNPSEKIAGSIDGDLISSTISSVTSGAASQGSESFSSNLKMDVQPALSSVIATLNGAQGQVYASASAVGSSATSGVSSGISGFVSNVSSAVSGAANAIRSTGSSMYDSGYYSGSMAGQGVVAGLNSMIHTVAAAAMTLANNAANALASALRINSPSKVTMKIGESVGEGFGLGITNSTWMATDAAESMSSAVVSSMVAQVAYLSDLLDEIDASPTITPVLDLDNVAEGMSALNGMLLDDQMISASKVNAFSQNRAATASNVDNSRAANYYIDLHYTKDSDATQMVMDLTNELQSYNLMEA